MKGKKLLALALSASMVAGSNMMALAADQKGEDEGTGEVQYVATSDVFSVVLPTEAGTTFDYLLDPDGLIKATSGSRYNGKVFDDDKTLYFLHASKVDGTVGGTAGTANCDYTDTSDEITVINKSTGAVDLTVTAKIAAADGVKMAATADMTGDGENLYMALVGNDGAADDTKAITTEGVELTASIAPDANAYEVKWIPGTGDEAGKYEKSLTTAAQASDYTGFKSYTFKLTGACKANDTALTALKENPPKIDLTWSVKDFTDTDAAPSIATRTYTLPATAQAMDIPVSLGAGTLAAQAVTDVQWKEGNNFSMMPGIEGFVATYAGGKVTLSAETVTAFKNDTSNSATLIVVFDDDAETKIEVTLSK